MQTPLIIRMDVVSRDWENTVVHSAKLMCINLAIKPIARVRMRAGALVPHRQIYAAAALHACMHGHRQQLIVDYRGCSARPDDAARQIPAEVLTRLEGSMFATQNVLPYYSGTHPGVPQLASMAVLGDDTWWSTRGQRTPFHTPAYSLCLTQADPDPATYDQALAQEQHYLAHRPRLIAEAKAQKSYVYDTASVAGPSLVELAYARDIHGMPCAGFNRWFNLETA